MPIKVLNQTGYAIYRAVIQSYLTAYVQFHRYVANVTMNSTVNGSSGSWSCFNFTAGKIGGTVAFCLIFIVSLVANSLIVIIVYKTPNLRKPINFFIANMASSDLLAPIFWIPLDLSYLHTNNSFLIGGQLGQALCKLVNFFIAVSLTVSVQNLILIAVDRFGAVVFPLRSPLIRSKLCPFFILTTWIVAVAFNSPDLFTYELVENPEGARCVTKWKKAFGESSSASFLLAFYILFTYIPVLSLVILYSIIFIKLKTQEHPGEQSANTQQQRNRRNRNVLQMSIAIVTVFVFCSLPYSLNHLITEYQDTFTHFSCSFRIYDKVTFYMAYAYCAINPVICFMFSSNYRTALKRLIKCTFVQA